MDISKTENLTFTRREVAKIALVVLGESLVATGCSNAPNPPNSAMGKNPENAAPAQFFNAKELMQLAEIAEILIPTTDTPGARAANVHIFIDRMMSQWALARTQAAFRTLLDDINASARTRFGAPFMDLSPQQRFDLISAMDAAAFNHESGTVKENLFSPSGSRKAHQFIQLKQLVFLGYYQSEIGATQELQFKLVPGRYEACVPLSKIGRAWAGEPWNLSVIRAQMRASTGEKAHEH